MGHNIPDKRVLLFSTLVLAIVWLPGCPPREPMLTERLLECQDQLMASQDENTRLTRELVETHRTIELQEEQIQTLQEVGPAPVEQLVRVQSIRLERLTRGYDETGDGYEDGVVIYLQPIDDAGHVIKAAGSVRVRIFELNEEPRLVGECRIAPEELEETWIGRFWTNHYTVRCPFAQPPTSRNITLRVDFTELLTRRTFIAEKSIEINIPPTAQPDSP